MRIGYIKLFRKLLDWEWLSQPETFQLFVVLLLKSNHQDSAYQGFSVPRGSCVIGRKALAKELGVSEQSIRTSLLRLKSTNELTIKSTNKFSIVTITNYNTYQSQDFKINQQINQQINQPTTTSKECKNDIRNDNVSSNQNFLESGLAPKVVEVTKKTTTYVPIPTEKECAPPPLEWTKLKNRIAGVSDTLLNTE